MRSATILTVLGATLALGSPVNHQLLQKKALVTHVVTDIVYITVTAGHDAGYVPTPMPEPVKNPLKAVYSHRPKPKKPSSSVAAPSYTPPPPPPPPPVTYAPPETPPPAAPTPEATYKAAEAPAPAPETYPTDYKSIVLWHHNQHRLNHSTLALLWDDTLAKYAEASAKKCVFAHDMTQGEGGYGQNIAASGTTDELKPDTFYVADSITNQWYNGEVANMPYGQDSPPTQGVPEFMHLSQIVWKDTTLVGCYSAECGAGTIFSYHSSYTVCNYKVPGNVLGSFIEQVPRPIGLPTITA
ncbi:hypothetical protein QTJ16_006713 [Diplocarpon rosae]|uniref:SCP domain-containing protein n=1 Tax=Diplocarpon rosae TaxID=946125 RepID=A0AAD9WCR5_9HELO|nr:hypothetical protein QTJ16_006713 [Diplocarpon rosae]PBP19521.1 scp-like extracellular protein [Diplocarpon rosae]